MLDSTKIDALRGCFESFGKVVDVYIGRHKDKAGRNFAFVKFAGVRDVQALEGEMHGVVCGGRTLTVNAAKYSRSKASAEPLNKTPHSSNFNGQHSGIGRTTITTRTWGNGGN